MMNQKILRITVGCSFITSYYFGLFWTPPLSYCVITWLTHPPTSPHMYDTINEYVFSLSKYFSFQRGRGGVEQFRMVKYITIYPNSQ